MNEAKSNHISQVLVLLIDNENSNLFSVQALATLPNTAPNEETDTRKSFNQANLSPQLHIRTKITTYE
jgi:hypothetical protein